MDLGEDRDRQQELRAQWLIVVEELSKRKQRLERLSREVVSLEHKFASASFDCNFGSSSGMAISSAGEFVRGIKRRLNFLRNEQQQALEEVQRAVERQELLEDEIHDLEHVEIVSEIGSKDNSEPR